MTSSWTTLLRQLITVAVVVGRTTLADATCSDDQVTSCTRAASSGQWSSYAAGGECLLKQYVQFTHLCTVTNYLPSVDHCCCPLDTDHQLLCCRYHQGWYHFRCVESRDKVDIHRSSWSTSWQFLTPVIILPLLLVAAVAFICVTRHPRWRRRTAEQPETEIDSTLNADNKCCSCIPGVNAKQSRDVDGVGQSASRIDRPPSYTESPIQPTAPPLDVTSSTVTEVTWTAPFCHACGSCGASDHLPPPSYDQSQRLHCNSLASS